MNYGALHYGRNRRHAVSDLYRTKTQSIEENWFCCIIYLSLTSSVINAITFDRLWQLESTSVKSTRVETPAAGRPSDVSVPERAILSSITCCTDTWRHIRTVYDVFASLMLIKRCSLWNEVMNATLFIAEWWNLPHVTYCAEYSGVAKAIWEWRPVASVGTRLYNRGLQSLQILFRKKYNTCMPVLLNILC